MVCALVGPDFTECLPRGVRKVVLATNVAETSITIDDCGFVIDTGRAREVEFVPETGLSRLADVWVSQAAARQRRGRAGRVQKGTCFRLYSKGTFEALELQQAPEMHRQIFLKSPLYSDSRS